MNKNEYKSTEKWILWGIPSLFLAGSILHFAFDALGKRAVAGLFSPVNESIWEHTKLAYIPTLFWWGGYWLKKRKKLPTRVFLSGALTAVISSVFTVPVLYYFYTGAFGFKSLWVDISLLFIAVSTGQLAGMHIFKRVKKGLPLWLLTGLFVLIGLAYAFLTFNTPHLPLFSDPSSKTYGI